MKKPSSKETSDLQRLWKWVDGLISFGFAAGVLLIIVLFFYVLFTQFIGKAQ